MEVVIGGEYEHFKGKRYRVIAIGKHSETLEEMVVYQGQYDDNPIWVRPLAMFTDEVTRDGKTFPRFKYIKQ